MNINEDVLDLNSIERGSSGRVTKLEIQTDKGCLLYTSPSPRDQA